MVNRWLWGLLGLLALALAVSTRAPSFAWAGCVVFGILAVSQLLGHFSLSGVKASRRCSADRVPFGGRVWVEVELHNDKLLPALWLAIKEGTPAGLPILGPRGRVVSLWPRGAARFSYSLVGLRRGYYRIGPASVRSGDVFGLVEKSAALGERNYLTVYPRVVPLEHPRLSSRRPLGEVRARRAFEDPTRIAGVRPYSREDGLGRIHWKATAHTGELQSKLYEVTSHLELSLVLNLNQGEYPLDQPMAQEAAELAITAAASVAAAAAARRQSLSLVSNGRDGADRERALLEWELAEKLPAVRARRRAELPRGRVNRIPASRDKEQLARLLSQLGRLELGPGPSLAQMLVREHSRLPWTSLVVVITPAAEGPALGALLGLRSSGFALTVLLTGEGAEADRSQASLLAERIDARRVRREEDLRGLGI